MAAIKSDIMESKRGTPNSYHQQFVPVNKTERRRRRWIVSSRIIILIGLIFLPGFPVPGNAAASSIRLNSNGGYEDIVVSIGKEVPPIACQQLIQNIQGIFTSGSEYLKQATDGRVYFHRIVIVVPPTWDTRACGRALPPNSFTSRSSTNSATVRIGTEHPVFGHLPWTQQSRGCGLEGDFISIGYHSILQFNETENGINGHVTHGQQLESNDNGGHGPGTLNKDNNANGLDYAAVPTDRTIVAEWAKFRYGVFEEMGFRNDPIYPPSYFEGGERKPTACTNHPLQGNWSADCIHPNLVNRKSRLDKQGEETTQDSCTLQISANSRENERITSSILSFPAGRSVHRFCDASNHNFQAPTKQNFLCNRKSVSDVIYEHEDFRNLQLREPNVVLPPPEFIVKQITQPRFVLLVEETGNMNLRDVWKFLKLAVRKFIKYDLPTGTQLGMIAISTNEVRILANMTSLQSLTIRRALADKLPNYPNVDSGGNISLRRGIFQAVEVLRRNQQRPAGSVIILLSQGTVSTVELETSLELLRAEEVSLAAIEYPSLGDAKISQLAEGTGGPHFAIRETGVGPTTHMSTFVQLINALMSIQTFYTEDVALNWPTMIHQAEYKGDSRSYIESNFSFESTSSQSPAEFFIYTSNPNDPKINSVELVSPNGVKYETQLSDLHDINVIKIDASINEPGVWRYRIERLADSHQSHFIQVVTKTSSEDLTVRLYSNVNENKVTNLSSTPLILFTEVKRKNSPVIEAEVEVSIVATNRKWTLKLLDNGNGDPDLTRGDGVYSRYVVVPPGLTTSQLEITARVVVNPYRAKFIVVSQDALSTNVSQMKEPCCGSVLTPSDPKSQYKIVPFGERTSNSLLVRFAEVPPLGHYPPGRIGDLRMVKVEPLDKSVTLAWTAPGEDFDQGIASAYRIFCTIDTFNEDWKLLKELIVDLESGAEDNATLTLPYFGSFLLTIRAIDAYGNVGKVSNVVRVSLIQPPRESETTFSSKHGNTLGITNTTPPSTEELTRLGLVFIIICTVVSMILVTLLIVFLLYCRKMSTTSRKSSKTPNEGKIAAIADPKSPIHWSASELLGEHEKRHSLYGGNGSPDESKRFSHHSMHLNIRDGSPTGHGNNEYTMTMGTGSSPSRRTSSPDSYDDPESPAPIPVSVRNRPEYAICNESRHPGQVGHGVPLGYHHPPPSHIQYHHYQTPQNNSGYPPQARLHGNNRFSINSGVSSSSPLPPQQNGICQLTAQQRSHLAHYDPEIQGSMTSVNSKKRNITMV